MTMIRMTIALCLALTVVAWTDVGLLADIVTLNDGSRFEGIVVLDDGQTVRIDVQINQTRTTIGFPRRQVESMEAKALPPGYFEPVAEERKSDVRKVNPNHNLYIEVPIKGILGKDVPVRGVRAGLVYAKRHGIDHVVFTIDSAEGSFDETMAIYRVMEAYKGKGPAFHAVIRKCIGPPLAVALWCDTVHVMPGAVVGGSGRKLSEVKSGVNPEDEDVLREQFVKQIIEETGKQGAAALVVRAMIDVTASLAAWKDDDGVVEMDEVPPPGLAKQLIFEVKPGAALQLNDRQAAALGLPRFEGTVQELGLALRVTHWEAESDYGIIAMQRAAEREKKAADRKEASHLKRVEQNVTRRDTTERFIEDNMKQAAESDPTGGDYKKYGYKYHWGWGNGQSSVQSSGSYGWEANEWTKESQKKWRTRTDAAMHFLKQAGKGYGSMKRLDERAIELGLEPTYKKGEIDANIDDIVVKLTALKKNRQRKTG